jgi:hypothetical protein
MKKPQTEPKLGPVSFRVTARFREGLRLAAEADSRSQANMLHVILEYWLESHPVKLPSSVKKSAKTKAKK